MFGIGAEKFVVLLIIAALVLGPTKLPEYAAKLGHLVREVRRMASGARERLNEELGPDFQDLDWGQMDPRQYDPRRIIREALTDDIPPAPSDTPATGPATAAPPAALPTEHLPAG
ncbi:twin-arginine translocase TatA/TatE family subunit [Arthrobacter sp. TE12232]